MSMLTVAQQLKTLQNLFYFNTKLKINIKIKNKLLFIIVIIYQKCILYLILRIQNLGHGFYS